MLSLVCSENSFECPSCSLCTYPAGSPRTSWILKAPYADRAYRVPDPMKMNPPRGLILKRRAHSFARPSALSRSLSLGRVLILEARARRLVVKLTVPEVIGPSDLLGSGMMSSHSFARGLAGSAVTATRFLASLLICLASWRLALVLPLTDVMKTVLPKASSGY